jgi:hypothetical protein
LTQWTYGRSALATAITPSAAHLKLKSSSRQITPNPLEVGTDIELRFALTISEPWEGTAQIVWTRRPGEERPLPRRHGRPILRAAPQRELNHLRFHRQFACGFRASDEGLT